MYHLIANEESGAKRGKKVLKQIEQYLDQHGIKYHTYTTKCGGDAKAYTEQLTDKGDKVKIIALGGDGTYHEILNGIKDFDNTEVGFVPAGRGNDFARGAGLSRKPLKALESVLKDQSKLIDFIDISGVRSLNFAGTGLDIEVLERVIRKKKSGKLAYITSLMACLVHFKPYQIEVTEGGKTYTRMVIMVGVGNGSYFGGGINISPLSQIDDQKMNLIIINNVKHYKIPFMFASFLKGKHIKPRLKYYAEHIICDHVSIVNQSELKLQLDGEIYPDLPFNATLIKSKLKTLGL